MKTENLWLSVVVGVGVLLGVVVGGYLASYTVPVSAQNMDGDPPPLPPPPAGQTPPPTQPPTYPPPPPMCIEYGPNATEECTDGAWSGWNLSDKPMRAPGYYNIMIPPHSRVYIGINRVTRRVKVYPCGMSRSRIDRMSWQTYTIRTNTVCAKEQRPPEKDPGDSAVTTVDTTVEEVGDTVEPKDVPIYE